MAFIPTEHCARVVVTYAKGTEEWSNVYHATKTDFVRADMEALAAAVDAIFTSTVLDTFSSDVRYQVTTVYDIRTLTGEIVFDNSHTGPGTASFDVVPINTAVVVTLRTATRGRTGRGRSYIAGYSEGGIEDGEWNATTLAQALNLVLDIKAAIESAGWTMVIRSIQTDGIENNPAVTRPVTQVAVRGGKVGTQRRRVDRP